MVFCIAQGHAQNNRKALHDYFDNIRREAHEEFNDFRRQCMMDFLEFMSNPWKEFEEEKPVPAPKEDLIPPVTIPKEDKEKPIEDKPVVIEEVVEPNPVEPQPTPVSPIKEVPVEEVKYVDFTFFGTTARVRFDLNNQVKLTGVDEKSVVDALETMSGSSYDNMIIDCLALRENLQLSDWCYVQMLKNLADKIAGQGTNEAAVLLVYLYMQSGYKTRIATDGMHLYMLYASRYQIFDRNAFTVDNTLYYGVEQLPSRLHISQATFPGERELSLEIRSDQHLSRLVSKEIKRVSSEHPDVACTISVNQNQIDFYNSYPTSMVGGNIMTRWAMYANTPLDQEVRTKMYPQLRKHINGKSQYESVNILLDFVQNAFVYEYDSKEWGYDRAFFAEETLFYPHADCEDRAILFSRLVRDLIGLKVVLVFYPGHLAAAVQFTDAVQGDYLELQGQRFVVCDPTYIGAPVGLTMKGMDNNSAKVILLD